MARYFDAISEVRTHLGYGLRKRLQDGYSRSDFRADLLAGLVVGVVALPLSMALAIASGVAPQYGLYTTIVAGIVAALLGGCRSQVTGPSAAFVVILVPVVHKFGFGGLLVAGLMAGVLLMVMAALKLGRLISYIPHPVTTGFTMGIAVVIGTIQLKDFFGLSFLPVETFTERVEAMVSAYRTFSWREFVVGAGSLALLVALPKLMVRRIGWKWVVVLLVALPATKLGLHFGWGVALATTAMLVLLVYGSQAKLPAPLVMLAVVSIAVHVAAQIWPSFQVATIGTRFHTVVGGHEVAGIPSLPPLPLLPWHMAGGDGQTMHLSWSVFQKLAPTAFAIAMLGAIESLLAAVVADGMTGVKHDSNAELFALGVANVVVPFFGGIAATGALARTATNIRAGAQSPLAAVAHSVFILLCTVVLAPLVAYLPMAALAALLLLVARNMAQIPHFIHIVRVAPRADVVVLMTCFSLMVLFDMALAVSVGVVLAALLFMRRMADLTDAKLDTQTMTKMEMPEGVVLYEIAGPLFFGAAERAMEALSVVSSTSRLVVILLLDQVPTIDATGIVALETALARLKRDGHKVIMTGLRAQPAAVLAKAHIDREPGRLAFAPDLDTALSMAILHLARPLVPPPPPSQPLPA